MARNRTYLDAYLLPTFGAVPVARITTADIQKWISELHDAGKAAATISKTVSMLRAILDLAVRDKLIASSPAAVKLELPKAKQREMLVLAAGQVAELSQASGVFYRTLILTAAQTKMRWGELAGLPVDNVDLLRGEIRVNRQLVEIDGHHHITDQLKTPTSRRAVTIGRTQAGLLGEHIGRFPNDLSLVFTSTEGKYLRRSNFARQVLKPAAQEIKAPGLRFHDLRQTHASLLLASGEPVTEVSKRLGHRNPKITLEIYAHAIPGMERSSADTMDDPFSSVPTTVAEFRDRSDGMETGWDDSSNVVDFP
jgi:integrase